MATPWGFRNTQASSRLLRRKALLHQVPGKSQVWSTTQYFFLFPFCKKIIDLPGGKSMTPHLVNTILCSSSQQLPRLGPLKTFWVSDQTWLSTAVDENDVSHHIQNFSAIPYQKQVKPGQEASVFYSFVPADAFAGRPIGLTINLAYR